MTMMHMHMHMLLLLTAAVACVVGMIFPPLPKDGSTPTQQRLALYGPDCKSIQRLSFLFFGSSCTFS